MNDGEGRALNATLAVLVEMHRVVEETAEQVLKEIKQPENVAITYPPVTNSMLTQAEQAALEHLKLSPELDNALRKIMIDAISFPLFHLFTLVDGVAEPELLKDLWLGLSVNLKSLNDEESDSAFLHDEFYETYHMWSKIRRRNSD